MKIAFLSETNYNGKWPVDFPNARTEVAWQIALDATHYNIGIFERVVGYDCVFVIFPKGKLFVSAEGSNITSDINPVSKYLSEPIVQTLKSNNSKVYYIQEGPHWWWTDYEIKDQINFYNFISNTDGIFAHNESDVSYYRGLFPAKKVETIKSLMVDVLIKDVYPVMEEKVLIGGNFARWYGGFESYIIASEFNVPVWVQDSHAKRTHENLVENLNHLPRLSWVEWMKEICNFKYAVHLMPTVAAGTFSLNCAYFNIPCIGNIKVDTQRICHPLLSVDVSDLDAARKLAIRLRDDTVFYDECSNICRENYETYYSCDVWLSEMMNKL